MAGLGMIEMSEEALRAMSNLNANNDPNWIEVKNYLGQTRETLKRMVAFGIDITPERRNFITGLAWAFNDLFVYAEDPKLGLLKIETSRSRADRKLEGTG